MERLWSKRGYVYYPIISYQRIKFYRVEIMDIGILFWNNGVSEKFNLSTYGGIFCTG